MTEKGLETMNKTTRFILKTLTGLVLFWVGVSAACVLYEAIGKAPVVSRNVWAFLIGVGVYLLVQFFLYRPLLSHVLAHELTHALVAVIMGGKVTAIHATTAGGSTTVNKSGFHISLAPYVFPFYAALLVPVYLVAVHSFKPFLAGIIGLAVAYHLALTVFTLAHHQPDLKEHGVAFSLIFILCGNIIMLMLLTVLLWPEVLTWKSAFSGTIRWTARLAVLTYQTLKPLFVHTEDIPGGAR